MAKICLCRDSLIGTRQVSMPDNCNCYKCCTTLGYTSGEGIRVRENIGGGIRYEDRVKISDRRMRRRAREEKIFYNISENVNRSIYEI
jgi:hypothetical protein|tara:strand:+ start:12550 stop:12813 length:264 start_codon:yes stop_codon:yes gene_type:complete